MPSLALTPSTMLLTPIALIMLKLGSSLAQHVRDLLAAVVPDLVAAQVEHLHDVVGLQARSDGLARLHADARVGHVEVAQALVVGEPLEQVLDTCSQQGVAKVEFLRTKREGELRGRVREAGTSAY